MRRTLLTVGGLLLIVTLSTLARMTTWPGVFARDEVLLPGADAYYHMRRIEYAVVTGEGVPLQDRYQHFPEGAETIWPPWFDATWAIVLPLLGGDDAESLMQVAPFVPPILGAIAVLLIFLAARRLLPKRPAVAWFSAVGLGLLGGSITYTRLGFLDHHGAQAIWCGLLLLLGTIALQAESDRRGMFAGAATGVVLAMALLVWPGNLMLLAFWAAGLALAVLLGRERLRSRMCLAVISFGACALVLALGCGGSRGARAGTWALTTLSWAQPALAAVITLIFTGGWLGAGRFQRPGAGAMIGGGVTLLVLAGLAMALGGEAMESAVDGARQWLTKDEEFQASVVESLPLLIDEQGELEFERAYTQLGFGLWILPLTGIGLIVHVFRRQSGAVWLLALMFAGLFALTLLQSRFVDTFGPLAALAIGWLLGEIWGRRWWRHAVAIALMAFLFWPSLTRLFEGVSSWASGDEDSIMASPTIRRKWQLHKTARWLRDNTPKTRGFYDVSLEPEYGVMSTWSRGHVITLVGRRPVVVNNFGDDLGDRHFEDSERFFETESAEEALSILGQYGCAYVVTEEPRDQTAGLDLLARFAVQLHVGDGLGLTLPGREPRAAIETMRLIFETGPPAGRPAAPGMFKVFERVAGARIEGRGIPGAPVELRVQVRTVRQRVFEWGHVGQCDETGRFELRCPYATEPGRVSLARISCEGLECRVEVPEEAVRSGASIEAPELE
ncbi:MAG: STT3 domain-containing protein [Planctomycetota bacterium]